MYYYKEVTTRTYLARIVFYKVNINFVDCSFIFYAMNLSAYAIIHRHMIYL